MYLTNLSYCLDLTGLFLFPSIDLYNRLFLSFHLMAGEFAFNNINNFCFDLKSKFAFIQVYEERHTLTAN